MSSMTIRSQFFGPDRRNDLSRERLIARVRAEFNEMPCLRLTMPQLQRLFALREDICGRVIATMVCEGSLWKSTDGRYGARSDH
jgi:hypothetical protein